MVGFIVVSTYMPCADGALLRVRVTGRGAVGRHGATIGRGGHRAGFDFRVSLSVRVRNAAVRAQMSWLHDSLATPMTRRVCEQSEEPGGGSRRQRPRTGRAAIVPAWMTP